MSYHFPDHVELIGFPTGPNGISTILSCNRLKYSEGFPIYEWVPPAGLVGVPVTTMKLHYGIWEITQYPEYNPTFKKYGGGNQSDPFGWWTNGAQVKPYYETKQH